MQHQKNTCLLITNLTASLLFLKYDLTAHATKSNNLSVVVPITRNT